MTKRTSYSDLKKRIKSLEMENAELKEANEILRGVINGLVIKNQELLDGSQDVGDSGEPESSKKSWWRKFIG